MKKCSDWDNDVLCFEDKNGNLFHLIFKGDKTIVCGETATGKSLIYNTLSNLDKMDVSVKVYDTSNIFLANKYNIYEIGKLENKLIIIDRADILLNKNIVCMINKDLGINKYLIFLRKPMRIELSPNYFGELIRNNNKIELRYMFKVKGWN